jgi:hypothetical protein
VEQRISLTPQRLCLAAGPAMAVILLVGFLGGAKWLPSPSPTMSAEQLVEMYQANRFGFQLGFFLMIIGVSFMAPWGVALAMWTAKTEARFPILTYVQLVAGAVSVAEFVILYIPWSLAAYRAGEISPEITQMLHEFGWFMFLFDVPPYSIWLVALGLGILWNPREHQLLPRWSGYYTLVEAFLIVPAMLVIFFKRGPFAYNGFLALWFPFFSFLIWMMVMTYLCWKALDRQVEMDEAAGIDVHRHHINLDSSEPCSAHESVNASNPRVAADVASSRSLTVT